MAIDEWSKGLMGFTADEIAQGIDLCRSEEDWPPSIATFRKLCKQHSAPYHREYFPGLPRPKATLTLVKSEVRKMKEAVK